MTIETVRRLAADMLNVGRNKIRISPDGLKEAEGALTRSDVRGLIDKGVITKLKPSGRASTGRKTRTGHGRRKGTPMDSKSVWMMKVRAQRRFLRMLLEAGTLKAEDKRSIYGKVKSGIFRNKRAMLLYLKENELVPTDYEIPKGQAPQKKAARGRSVKKPAAQKAKAAPSAKEAKGEAPKAHAGRSAEAGPHRKEKGEQ